MEADPRPVAERVDDRAGRLGDLERQRRAVRVAQAHSVGAGVRRRAQALERIGRVVAEPVEEVLGVVDDALAGGSEERDRLGDHREVLIAVDAHDLLEVQRPRLADDRADRGERARQDPHPLVLVGRHAAPARHPERGDLRPVERLAREQLEQLELLGVRRREAGLDQVHAQLVEAMRDAQLLVRGQRHPLTLHPVAQGRVVELDGGHATCGAGDSTGTGSSHSR
jgi:hypothetical protein